jgi:hypothetical protein
MKNEKKTSNLKEIQNILLGMAKEIHNANTTMKKSELSLMFRKADSIRDMAKYIVASQNAMQSDNAFLLNFGLEPKDDK